MHPLRCGGRTVSLLLLSLAAGCAHDAAPSATPNAAAGSDARAVFARYKAVTGGAAWDHVTAIASQDTIVAGGMTGKATSVEDSQTGRSVTHFTLGPIEGANGFDGTHSWDQDPGGEVTAKDSPDAVELARSDVWMTARGYFRADLLGAQVSVPHEEKEGARRWTVVEATPPGGRLIHMWFDGDSGLLGRVALRRGVKTTTTTWTDYREEAGVRVPFHFSEDTADATGHVDSREHVDQTVLRIAINPSFDEASFAVPAMAATARIDDPSGVARIPFRLLNNHIYVDGSINGKPVHLLVDTGGANVLSPAAADRLGLAHEGKLAAGGVGAQQVDMAFAHANEVRVGAAALAHPVFFVMDLPDWKSMEGIDADGLVGFEMFRRFRVTVDYAGHVLTLAQPDKFVPPAGAHVVPFELAERIPIVTGTLDGIPSRISVDTGSRSSLTLHAPFVREHDLAKRYGAAPETVTGWGVGGASKALPARLGELDLGDVAIKDVAADLSTAKSGEMATPELAANLGGGILKRFTVTFDYDARKMYLVPNADFGKPDPWDRSGTWVVGDGDGLKVLALAPGGAAEKAGLKVGDRLVSIAGQPASAKNVSEWRALFREEAAGTRIPVEIASDAGQTRKATVTLADAIPDHARKP